MSGPANEAGDCTVDAALDAGGDPDFMVSLARGLAVMRCFAQSGQAMTIAEGSRRTGLSRPAVRRCLHTLARLGYVEKDGNRYVLCPRVMSLGYAYLSSSPLVAAAQPVLDRLRDELGESCSLGVVEEEDVCYIARAEISRIMSISLRVGSRLPLFATSMGRVLLSGMTPAQRAGYFRKAPLEAFTPRTCTSPSGLEAICQRVAEEGHAIVDQELEPGLRSVAVPVRDRAGRTIAALNVGTQALRVPLPELRQRHLPALRHAAWEIEALRP